MSGGVPLGGEHDVELLRPVESELHVGDARQTKPLEMAISLRRSRTNFRGQTVEAILGDGGQQIASVAEVPVWRVVGNSGAPGYFAKRKAVEPFLAYQREGGGQQSGAQV